MKSQKHNRSSNVKAINVGEKVSKTHFQTLKNAYESAYPGTTASFKIPKALIQKVLSMSPKLTGIRFMYGLSDALNPNSLRVFLIPCTNVNEYDMASKPLVSNFGYYDHEDELHTIHAIAEMMSHFVQNMLERNDRLAYKTTTRGNFVGRETLKEIIAPENCENITYHLGLVENQVIQTVLERSDSTIEPMFWDYLRPCPKYCPDLGTDPCVATLAVESNSKEGELDFFRWFRDHELLKQKDGGMLYEMYYFISPLIAAAINQKSDGATALSKLYSQRISPFKALLEEKRYAEATTWLKMALDELAATYNEVFEVR